MRAQKYIKRHPKECMHNLSLITPEDVQIWDAIRDGDLTRLKALHNEGHSIGFYINSQMDVACEHKHLHIVQYLYEKNIGYNVNILSHFPVLKNAVDENAATDIAHLQNKLSCLQNSLKSILSICNTTKLLEKNTEEESDQKSHSNCLKDNFKSIHSICNTLQLLGKLTRHQ